MLHDHGLGGTTALDDDDLVGLIPADIATRRDLDHAEAENIVAARMWAATRCWAPHRLLHAAFVRDLHRRMFGDVWRWAGQFRRRDTNIGVGWQSIPMEVRSVLDDAATWIEFGTYPPDETALRLHHRLVLVHPFANGNGRHARFVADLLVRELGEPPFTWGGYGVDADVARGTYLSALRAMDADRDDVAALLAFARA